MSEKKEKREFPGNPLPCGCGAVGTPGIDQLGNHMEYRQIHVKHCPRHASLETTEAALRESEKRCDELRKEYLDLLGKYSAIRNQNAQTEMLTALRCAEICETGSFPVDMKYWQGTRFVFSVALALQIGATIRQKFNLPERETKG